MTTVHKGHSHGTRRGAGPFVRHFLEMVAAMAVGMIVLGAATYGFGGLTGLRLPEDPALGVFKMAFDMSVGMIVWMRIRGHGWAGTLEMAAVMFVPGLVLVPLLWTDVIGEGALMIAEHAAMLPLMLLAMLRRRHEYGA